MNEQCWIKNGRTVYQTEQPGFADRPLIRRAVQQPDGTWWLYSFYKGNGVGAPLRGKSRQQEIRNFIAMVRAALTE